MFRPYDANWQKRIQLLLDEEWRGGISLLEKWLREALSGENKSVDSSKTHAGNKIKEVLGLIDDLEGRQGG